MLLAETIVAPIYFKGLSMIVFKGAGFCINSECICFYRPTFYMGTEESYLCRACNKYGFLEKNYQTYQGTGLIRTVVTHFKYDPVSKHYHGQASVEDKAIPEFNTMKLHLYRPFIRTDKSALMLAEKAFADVATGHSGLIMDYSGDVKLYKEGLAKLAKSLQSEYLRADLGLDFISMGELT